MSEDMDAMRRVLMVEAARSSPVARPWRRDALALLVVHGAMVVAALAVALWVLDHPPTLRPAWGSASTVLLATATLAGLISAVSLGRLARQFRTTSFAVGALAVSAHLAVFWGPSAPLLHDADCALAELAIAAIPATITVLTLRRFAYRFPRAVSGGMAAALTGLLVLDLTCPANGLLHAVLFHALPAALVLVAAVAARARGVSYSHVP
ncbi:MAG: hypothetical protein OXU20_11160 [Myxococcales bacterium]|nr:hypothetical protein [Myxococcales bacterium]MDD9965425.1 hypothetical protein [Myxococcales bacterium]